MHWNLILVPVLLCFLYGTKQGVKVKSKGARPIDRRTTLWE
jgi:hypothetical protein